MSRVPVPYCWANLLSIGLWSNALRARLRFVSAPAWMASTPACYFFPDTKSRNDFDLWFVGVFEVVSRELDFQTVDAKFEHQPSGRRHDTHNCTILILHRRAATAARNCDPGSETGVVAVEVREALEIEYFTRQICATEADITSRSPVDAERDSFP